MFTLGENCYDYEGNWPTFRPKLAVRKSLLIATCQGQTILMICFYKQILLVVFFTSNEFMIHINTRVNETYIIVSVNSFLAFSL